MALGYVDDKWRPKRKKERDKYYDDDLLKQQRKIKRSLVNETKDYIPSSSNSHLRSNKKIPSHVVQEVTVTKVTKRELDEEMLARELKAKSRKFTVMAGHKSGYELITDPELIKVMGRKQL